MSITIVRQNFEKQRLLSLTFKTTMIGKVLRYPVNNESESRLRNLEKEIQQNHRRKTKCEK